jgi:hypothetical protein
MNYKVISKGLYAAGITVIVVAGIVAISQGWNRSEFGWILIPGAVLEIAGYGASILARNQDKERVAKELKAKTLKQDERKGQ